MPGVISTTARAWLLFSGCAQAVTISAYWLPFCDRMNPHTICRNIPQNSCCRFPSGANGGTSAVGWDVIPNCAIGSWYWPNPRAPAGQASEAAHCGTVRDSVIGYEPRVCMTANVPTHGDGAMWLDLLKMRPGTPCPQSGTVKTIAGIANFLGLAKIISRDEANTTQISGPGQNPKADTMAALTDITKSDPRLQCDNVVLPTLMGWTNGTGVWVLEPNKAKFDEYEKLTKAEPSLSYNDRLKKVGATYYDHWDQHPDTSYVMGGSKPTTPHVRRAEIQDSFPGVPKRDVEDSFPGVPKRDVAEDSFPRVPKREVVKDSFPGVPQSEGVEDSFPLIPREDDGSEEKSHDSFPLIP